jgi:coproporphyrinogen III oxidase-like Fe-S oxidoreductase
MTEPQPAWPSLVWSVIEMGACPGVIDEAELSRRFGAGVVSRISGILEPMVARGLFDRTEGGFRTTRTGAMWMANVQSEILREAGLPSPIGHRIRH